MRACVCLYLSVCFHCSPFSPLSLHPSLHLSVSTPLSASLLSSLLHLTFALLPLMVDAIEKAAAVVTERWRHVRVGRPLVLLCWGLIQGKEGDSTHINHMRIKIRRQMQRERGKGGGQREAERQRGCTRDTHTHTKPRTSVGFSRSAPGQLK